MILDKRKIAAQVLWYGSYLLIASKMVGEKIIDFKWDLVTFQALLAAIILLAFFAFIHLSVQYFSSLAAEPVGTRGQVSAYPSPATKKVALYLTLTTIFSLVSVLFGLWVHGKPDVIVNNVKEYATNESIQLVEAFIAMTAAAVGSSVTTILGYLKHASENKDFKVEYIPWYIARPAMGMLLGLIFYFVVKGGLLVLLEPQSKVDTIEELNPWGVAGLGALVGMFSKQAIEKLREVFNTMFKTDVPVDKEILAAAKVAAAEAIKEREKKKEDAQGKENNGQ